MQIVNGCGLAALMLSVATSAGAADGQDLKSSGPEFGIGFGQATIQDTIPGVVNGSQSTTAFNVLGGYRFDRYLSVEAGYLEGGKFTAGAASARLAAAQLSAVGTLPLGDHFALFARGGADHWWVTNSGYINRFLCGGGAEVLWEGALLRAEYQQSKFPDQDIGGMSAHVRHQYLSAAIVWLF